MQAQFREQQELSRQLKQQLDELKQAQISRGTDGAESKIPLAANEKVDHDNKFDAALEEALEFGKGELKNLGKKGRGARSKSDKISFSVSSTDFRERISEQPVRYTDHATGTR
eukprot:gene20992-25186_t